MKYVLISSWCKRGSTGKIVYNLFNHIKSEGHEVYFFHGKLDDTDEENIIRITSEAGLRVHGALARITGLQGCFSNSETKTLIQRIDEINPDYVYLFNLHGYYVNEFKLLNYLKKRRQKTIYMLFDEYPYLGKCCFSEGCEKFKVVCEKCPKVKDYPKSLFFDQSKVLFQKKQKAYDGWTNLHFAGVKYIEERAAESALAKNIPFHTFNMGIDLETTYYPRKYDNVQKLYNIPDGKKYIMTVGFSSDSRKGIDKYIEIARKCEKIVDTIFIHIGYDKEIDSDLPSNFFPIKYVGNQQEMAEFYAMADLYVSTSSGEAMSNACLEALACGTPIAGFNVSGMSYLAPSPIGTYIEYGDLDSFSNMIKELSKKEPQVVLTCRKYAEENYNLKDFMRNLYDVSNCWEDMK